MNTTPYYCNRPTWASRLMSRGFHPEVRQNPWSPDRKTWAFQATPALCRAVLGFYEEIGKPAPWIIQAGSQR